MKDDDAVFDEIVADLKPKPWYEQVGIFIAAVIMIIVMLILVACVFTLIAWACIQAVQFMLHFWGDM